MIAFDSQPPISASEGMDYRHVLLYQLILFHSVSVFPALFLLTDWLIVLMGTGLWASYMLCKCSTTELHPSTPICGAFRVYTSLSFSVYTHLCFCDIFVSTFVSSSKLQLAQWMTPLSLHFLCEASTILYTIYLPCFLSTPQAVFLSPLLCTYQ
jgi:hypothetical protein